MNKNYKIKFIVGDYTEDGHGLSESYTIISNIPVDELKSIQDSCKERLGFELRDLCDDSYLIGSPCLEPNTIKKLSDAGFSLEPGRHYDSYNDENDTYETDSQYVLNLWIDILMFLSPGLLLVPVDEIFDGYMSGVGYGAFYV